MRTSSPSGEPPTLKRVDRIVRSALRTTEKTLAARIAGRLPLRSPRGWPRWSIRTSTRRSGPPRTYLSLIKSVSGNVSLETMQTEVRKLRGLGGRAAALTVRRRGTKGARRVVVPRRGGGAVASA